MKRLALIFIALLLFTVYAPRTESAAKNALILLPVVNSSQVSDDWVAKHVQDSLNKRFPADKYTFPDTQDVNAFLRDRGFVAGFGALPDRKTVEGLSGRFTSASFLALEITRAAYKTTNMSLTVHTGKEQVMVIINAVIYDAATGKFQSYNSRQTAAKELGPFTPYEQEDTITAGLDMCIRDILSKVTF